MIVFLLATLVAIIISSPFSSALFDPSKENIKMMTEDEWPSHGPWIVTVGNLLYHIVILIWLTMVLFCVAHRVRCQRTLH